MLPGSVDVVVVGAGLSGLSAARHILQKDPSFNVLVLEAKGRLGGRTLVKELKAASGTDTWDLGGQWIGNCQPHVMALVEELGIEVKAQYSAGIKIMQLTDNKVRTYKSDIPTLNPLALIDLHLFMNKMERMSKQVNMEDPTMCPHAAEWDGITMETAKQRWLWTQAARDCVDAAGRTIFGAESSQVSVLYYLCYASAAGGLEPLIKADKKSGQQYKIVGGSAQLSERLADKIGRERIHVDCPIVSIKQGEGKVTITTLGGEKVECERLILAIPPHQAAKLVYEPALPYEKVHVLNRMPVGNIIKIIVTYSKPFWREKGYSGEIVTCGGESIIEGCDTGPLCIVFDATTSLGNAALVTFMGGNQAVQYGTKTREERERAVLHSLSECLGKEALSPIEYAEHDWRLEPYNGGGPVSMGTPGMMTYIAPGLRQPFDRIHFAGTESATVWCGFLNGAIQSGVRAATEVMYNLRPQTVTGAELEETCYGTRQSRQKHPFKTHRLATHHVLRWTVGIGTVCILAAVARKVYFGIRILL